MEEKKSKAKPNQLTRWSAQKIAAAAKIRETDKARADDRVRPAVRKMLEATPDDANSDTSGEL